MEYKWTSRELVRPGQTANRFEHTSRLALDKFISRESLEVKKGLIIELDVVRSLPYPSLRAVRNVYDGIAR